MNSRIPTVEAVVEVFKLMMAATVPMGTRQVARAVDVSEPSVRHYLDIMESRGILRFVRQPGVRGALYEWVRT